MVGALPGTTEELSGLAFTAAEEPAPEPQMAGLVAAALFLVAIKRPRCQLPK